MEKVGFDRYIMRDLGEGYEFLKTVLFSFRHDVRFCKELFVSRKKEEVIVSGGKYLAYRSWKLNASKARCWTDSTQHDW